MMERNFRRDSKGQVIVITALLVAVLLLSTALYVVETEKEVPTASGLRENNVFQVYQQSARNTLISALANVTNSSNPAVLASDLNQLKSAVISHSYQAILQMDYTPLNSVPYQNGFWISWGADGYGVSSAYVSFNFNLSGNLASSNSQYSVNVSSEVYVSGNTQILSENSVQISLTVRVLNDGKAALAQTLAFYFENDSVWTRVDSPSIADFGNGTYSVVFTVETGQPSDPIPVSVSCLDQRGILVDANVTCASTG
jgi:hypothetical protein